MRLVALCVVVALAGCGGGGGSAPTVTPATGLVVNWVSLSGSSGGAGTQGDPIHLAYPPLGVVVTASRGGVAQQINLTADSSCTAVSVAASLGSTTVTFGVDASSGVAYAGGMTLPGPWDLSWSIVSAGKGSCGITVTAIDGVTARLQVYSEM